MATFKALLNNTFNKKPKADGTYSVIIRVTENRKHKYFGLSHSVKESQWNSNPRVGNDGIPQYVRKSHPSHKTINKAIYEKIEEMRAQINSLSVKTPERIKEAIKSDSEENSFLEFFENRLEVFKADLNCYRKWKRYNSVLNNLKKFLNGKGLSFEELDHDFVDAYRKHRTQQGKDVSTDFKKLSAILNEAIRRDKYKKLNLFTAEGRTRGKKKRRKQALTILEFARIKQLELPENSLIWHVRNFFVLNFYFHGSRVGDALQLKQGQIQEGRLLYDMSKNEKSTSFKIPEAAYKFLDYYTDKDAKPDYFLFPFLSNDVAYSNKEFLDKKLEAKTALINKYLKKVAKKAEIDKTITSHVARHTFASTARDKIKDISKIQVFMRHSSIKETQIYLSDLTDKSLDESTDEIFG